MSQTLTTAHVEALAQVELFERLDRVALARLAACADLLVCRRGQIVCRQGDPADGLYVILRGTFGIFAVSPDPDARLAEHQQPTPIGTFQRGDVLGELALLLDEPRTATIRAETNDAELLRIEKERFSELLRGDPVIGLQVAATLGRRLREWDRLHLEDREFTARMIGQALAGRPADLVECVLQASLVPLATPVVLDGLFGAQALPVAETLATLGLRDGQLPGAVARELQARLRRELGEAGLARLAERLAGHLLEAGRLDEALQLLHAHGEPAAFATALARALRAPTPLPPDRAEHWVAQLGDGSGLADAELALARAALHERRQVSEAPPTAARRRAPGWRAPLGLGLAGVCLTLAVLGRPAASGPLWSFAWLLAAAAVLWISELMPASIIGLGLLAAWVLTGTAEPEQAAAGFASPDWLFVLAVFGLAGAVARSGLLFRVGLLLVRRLPHGLFWQAGTLLLTGLLLTPLLPTATGRSALTGSLALSVVDGLRIRDRQPAAAVLGLAAWIGAGPLLFTFLNGSALCLLAWGLLPPASRAHFDFVTWSVAALPLAAVLGLGCLVMLFVVFRPEHLPPTSRGRVDVQLGVLGPPSRQELGMLAILLLVVAGWMAAPALRLDVGVIAIVGLLAAVATGHVDRQAIRELDWDYLVFYGVALSLVRLGAALGLDRLIGETVGRRLVDSGASTLVLVLAIAAVTVLVRLLLGPDQVVLLLSLALIPSAASLGMDPWVIVITILAATGAWLLPSQMPSFLAAHSASEGRLYSHAQARLAAAGYVAVLAGGLLACVPYWHLLGLL